MAEKNNRAVRKQLREHAITLVEARWRKPWRWLPGLPNGYFKILMFPRLQWFFQFRMMHAINQEVKSDERN